MGETGEFDRRVEWDKEMSVEEFSRVFQRVAEKGEREKKTTIATVVVYVHQDGREFCEAMRRDDKVTMQVLSASKNPTMKLIALLQAFNDLCAEEGTPDGMLPLRKHILEVLLDLHTQAKEHP